jgi:adenosylcobinamide kinase/adenosylcobinamide-phosphate guanylyltransferase
MGEAHLLVIGGQRSGKSAFAENLIAKSGKLRVYIATAARRDGEMAERIATHRARRGPHWTVIEEPLELPSVLEQVAEESTAVLVDCLTLWLANLFEAKRDIDKEVEALIALLESRKAPVVLVSGEVGLGVIPMNARSRAYADALGTLNQRVAGEVGRVVFMAAGQPVLIKPSVIPEITL